LQQLNRLVTVAVVVTSLTNNHIFRFSASDSTLILALYKSTYYLLISQF